MYGGTSFPPPTISHKKPIFAHRHLHYPANLKGVRWVYEKEGQQPDGESQLVRVLPSEPLGGAGPLTEAASRFSTACLRRWSSLKRRPGLQRSCSRQRVALYGQALELVLCGADFHALLLRQSSVNCLAASEAPLVFQRAWMESVDGWPMANIFIRHLGVSLSSLPALCVDVRVDGILLLRCVCHSSSVRLLSSSTLRRTAL